VRESQSFFPHRHQLTQRLFSSHSRLIALLLATCGMLAPGRALAVGTWTLLVNPAPDYISLMLQLSDGTVMCLGQENGSNWYRLTPDTNGSYVNGTWTTLAPMHDSRLYCSSQVLRDGRVLVAGGEYGTGSNTAEYYQPTNDSWAYTPDPTLTLPGMVFLDSGSEVLPNGNVMVCPVIDPLDGVSTLIFNIVSNTWSPGPLTMVDQDEASWVKLPDQSILTIDDGSTTSERYIPALNQWIADGTVPVNLYNHLHELGAAFLLPNGNAFFIGGTDATAIYTPTGTTNAGTWALGPAIPGNLGANDAPAAMMVNGKVLCALGSDRHQDPPTYFYEYDYVSNIFTQTGGPYGGNSDYVPCYATTMLDLPDGTVLYADEDTQLYVYQPDGSPLTNGKPVITSVTRNADGSYHVTGTLFDGISEGAAYGDDWQMRSDYPIARITNSSGAVLYARTYNWSSTSVATGTNILTTEMTLPAGLTNGMYPLVISANGNSSAPFMFTVGVNTTPTNIIASLNGTNLNLSWPVDHIGWRLLVQTNHLATGVSSSTNDWGTVAGSASTNLISIPIDRTKPADFYRLIYP
jgi:hypothetical protein